MDTGLQDRLKEKLNSLADSRGGELPLDDGVVEALPVGTSVISTRTYGVSAWSFTARIDAIDANGSPTPFFLKYVAGELGEKQLEGEFVGMTEMWKLAPDLVPRPRAWGALKSVQPASSFLLVDFREFVPGLPDPAKLGARLAVMHDKSRSPTGMFGFPIQTYDGARLQAVGWDPSWTSFFSKLLAEAYRQDTETNGIWPELDIVMKRVLSHLVPRLIGALEEDGRKVEPALIHGDLWDGNVATEVGTGDPWIFDCAAYYAHREMELGIWRAERHQLKAKIYRTEYLRHYEPSEPEEEWDDRNRLYSAKTNFMHSACWAGSPARQLAFEDFVYLIAKYVPWDEDDDDWFQVSQRSFKAGPATDVQEAGVLPS